MTSRNECWRQALVAACAVTCAVLAIAIVVWTWVG